MKNESLNSKQAVKLAKKFGAEISQKQILKDFKNGDFLFQKQNIETGMVINYFLAERYFQSFDMTYSCHHKIKSGRELFISNFELPDFKKFKNKEKK